MSSSIPKISFADYTLQLAGGKLLFYGQKNTTIQYNEGQYEVSKDIGLDSDISNPGIIIRHQIDDTSLKIYNFSECKMRVVGHENFNILPNRQKNLDVSLSETDYIDIKNKSTRESIRLDVEYSDSYKDEEVDNSGLADTLLKNPYSDASDTSELSLSRILEKADDAELIGRGSYRLAFRVNPSNIGALRENDGGIIKVAKTPTGSDINKQEMQTWQAVKGKEESSLFCPVTSIGPNHKYIVMKEAQNINTLNEDTIEKIENRIKSSILFEPEECKIPSPCAMFDIKSRNIGTYSGNVVLIDYPYGGNFEISSKQLEGFQESLQENYQ